MTVPADALSLRDIANLPGPPGLPVLGNLLQFRIAHVHRALERWSARYGPYFRLRLGKTTSLVVADAAALAAILRDRPDGFRRSDRVVQVAREMGLIVPGVFGAEGDDWRLQRRMVMSSFDPGHIKAYFPSMLKVTQRLRTRWLAAARTRTPIDLQADLMRYTVDTISGLAFGTDINTLESDDEVIQRHLDRIFPALMKRMFTLVPYWRWFKLPSDRELDRSVAAIGQAIDGFVAQARARLSDDPQRRAHPTNLLEALIVAADANVAEAGGAVRDAATTGARKHSVTDRHVAANVLTMLLAGEDTTANSLAWMIWLLRRNPDALARAQDEVRRQMDANDGNDGNDGNDASDMSALSPERLNALEYLDACVQETMRLKPVAPFMVVQALRETTIEDIRVPAGTYVWCVMRHASVDERQVPAASTFDPTRWMAAPAGDAAPSAGTLKRLTMPFGAGPRICPGRYLALLEIKLAMAMLLAHFDIASVDAPGGGDAVERMAFTMAPVGLKMRLTARAG